MKSIRKDLDKRPIEGVDGKADEEIILDMLKKQGIYCEKSAISRDESTVGNWQLAKNDKRLPTANRKLPIGKGQLPTDTLGYWFSPS